jgi:hypothetical protein
VNERRGEEGTDPRATVAARLLERRSAQETGGRLDGAIATARLAVFVAAASIGWYAWALRRVSGWWILGPSLVFAVLVSAHDRVLRRQERRRRAVAFYEAALARLDGRWAGQGTQGEGFVPQDHPYAEDLDLFGSGSVFELLCAARTRAGESALAGWLLAPAEPAEVLLRQRAVAELAPQLDLREETAVLGEDVRSQVDPERLSRWGEEPPIFIGNWSWVTAAGLALAATVGLAGWIAGQVGPAPFLLIVVSEAALFVLLRTRLRKVLSGVERPARELEVLSLLLARLQRAHFQSEKLRGLQQIIQAEGIAAAQQIGRLQRLVELLEWAENELFALVSFPFLWKVQLGLAVERWRQRVGPRLRLWTSALGELEALSSLGAYAFEHPQDPFPTFAAPSEGAQLRGQALGHPLLSAEACVRNDVLLQPDSPLLLISGSNMSGKSTLLRTVGVNAVLAQAGAPVRARSLHLSRLQVGATLRIQDSLQAGRSRFYAEITRLKQLDGLARKEIPLLFLLDELLHGTNSRDRRTGTEAVLRKLLQGKAIGLVTTHDLALTELAAALPGAANGHFTDQVIDGQIQFDYRLRPGVVTGSNALALMRSVGLEV